MRVISTRTCRARVPGLGLNGEGRGGSEAASSAAFGRLAPLPRPVCLRADSAPGALIDRQCLHFSRQPHGVGVTEFWKLGKEKEGRFSSIMHSIPLAEVRSFRDPRGCWTPQALPTLCILCLALDMRAWDKV